MKANVAARGKARVSIGSKCRNRAHSECTVLECSCACHAVDSSTTEDRK